MNKSFFILLIGLATIACTNNQVDEKETDNSGKPVVFAVNYPLLYFAEKIGGEHVELLFFIPADVDPAYWVPNEELEEIQQADLILVNGASYAKWMEKVSLPSSKVENTTEALSDQYIKQEQSTTHSHGSDGEHIHYGFAFTTWLDFNIAIGQAESVKMALAKLRPELEEEFDHNFDELKIELLGFNEKMIQLGKKLNGQTLFVSHPVYQYMARAYSLKIISLHWEPNEMPAEKDWLSFEKELENNPSDIMLWENEPGNELRKKLSELGLESVVFNPGGNKPENIDFSELMIQNIKSLEDYVDSQHQ